MTVGIGTEGAASSTAARKIAVTAVDSNVLFDVLLADPEFGGASERALRGCLAEGPVRVCPVVYAELSAALAGTDVDQFLSDLQIGLDPFGVESLRAAGEVWRTYRARRGADVQCASCGQRFRVTCTRCAAPVSWQQHLIPHFLVGAHAAHQAQRLLTRDRGYYRTYFPRLRLYEPPR